MPWSSFKTMPEYVEGSSACVVCTSHYPICFCKSFFFASSSF